MKTIRNLLVLTASAFAVPLNASTIQFSSNSTTADASENNSLGNNVLIQKNSAWADPIAGSKWISYGNTGDPSVSGFTAPANGTVVSFFQNFSLTAADLSTNGTVSLYADDSAAVILNGVTLMSEASGTGNTYSACSDSKPNCTSLTTLVLPSINLVLGNNVLRFDVAQRAGSSFGLDYKGSVGAPTPEPSTWAFMTTGVAALAAGLRKRFTGSTSPRT